MESLAEHLPTWALFSLGVVWLTYQFIQKFLERQGEKRDAAARREYREKRKSRLTAHSFDGIPKPRSVEDTGRHDLRTILDEEREREQRLEILGNTRDHMEMMRKLVSAEGQQAGLLKRIVDTQERQGELLAEQARTQAQLGDMMRAISRYLHAIEKGRGENVTEGTTLRDIPYDG
jgi:hypothetical protein